MFKWTENRFTVGMVGIVICLGFVYFTFTKKVPFQDGYRVEGVFQSTNQIRTGSPVRIAGVDVGKVVKVERGQGETAIVTMQIKKEGRPIHTDATAKIRPRLFLEGGFLIELKPGSPSAPEISDKGTIPLSQTAVPVQFHQLLTGFERPARESIRAILGELDTALSDGGAEALGRASKPFAPTLRDIAIIGEAARGSEPGDITDTIQATAGVTKALARRDQELGQLVGSLNAVSGALARNDSALATGVRQFNNTLIAAPPALDAIDRSLPPTEAFFADLRPSLPVAPGVLNRAPAFLRQIELISGKQELPRTIDLLDPTVKKLPQLERRLRRLLPTVKPVTDCVGQKALPVLKAVVPDGALSTGRPAWQDLVHAVTGLASAGQTFDANGHAIRYNLGAGLQTVSLGSSVLGQLVGNAESAIVGSNPQWLGPGRTPPFRPDQKCADQPAVNLAARTGGGAVATRGTVSRSAAPDTSRKDLKSLIKRSVKKLGADK